MASFNINTGAVGQMINAETVTINGQTVQFQVPATMAQARDEIAKVEAAVGQLQAVPPEVKAEAAGHLQAAKAAAEAAPKDKATVEGHLDKAAKVLKSATGVAGEVAGVLGAVLKIAGAIAAFAV